MQNIVNLLENTIKSIKDSERVETHKLTETLRDLQRKLRKEVFVSKSKEARLLAFFLNAYILSIFSNLFIDTPDDEEDILRPLRREFLKKISMLFPEISSKLKANNKIEIFNILADMVALYAETINKINLRDMSKGGRHEIY